ncbi:hypothetical protein [Pseudomonas sp. 3A(2025)]
MRPKTMMLATTRFMMMTTDVNAKIKEQALARLARIQRSPNYRSFFTDAAIDAFSKVEGSALAGKSLKREPDADLSH